MTFRSLKRFGKLYYAVCAPTLTFQAFAVSSSLLAGFVASAFLAWNQARTCLLTLLLGLFVFECDVSKRRIRCRT
jgi:hypothetical protein